MIDMRQQTNSFENLITRRVRTGRLRRFVAMLSAFVLLTTMNTLKLNADTLERIATCGIAQHVHDESCYDADGELACGLEEHVHTDACYQQRPTAEDKASTRIDEYVPLDAQVRLASPVEFISEDDEDTSVEISDVDDAVDEVMAELQNGDADDRGDEDDIDLLFTPDDEEALPVSGEDATEIDDTIFEVEGEEEIAAEDESEAEAEMIDGTIEGEVIEGEVTEGESIEGEVIEGETIEVETTDEENTKYTYELGDSREVLLSTVLEALGIQLDQIDSASAAKSDEAVLSVALNEDGDYVITALEGFEKGEIVVVGMEGETVAAYIIAITAAKAEEETEVGEADKAEEAPEIKTEEEVTEEKKDAEETVEEETEKAEENAEEQTEVEEIKDEDGAEEVQESDEESEAAEVAIVENDNVTIVPVGDNSLSGNLEIVYNENVNKQSVVDRLDAILSGTYQPGMMSTSSAAMSGLAFAGASAGNETAGQYSDYAVFDISLLDDGVQRSETGEVGVVVRPENVNIYDNLPGNATATNVEYTLYHIHNSAADTLPVSVDCGEDGSLLAVDFTTDSFSYFVLKYTVEYTTDNNEVTVKLDFTDIVNNGVDFDTNSVITALNDGVSVSISELEQGYIEGTDSVVNGELYIDYTTADNKNENIKNVNWIGFKVVSVDEGLTVADGKIKVTKDGTVVLSDGISTINIVITGYTRLVAEELSASGVDIEVLDGSVPAGSKVVYAEHSEEETQALVSEYNIEATDTVGAFDVSIAMPEGDTFKEEGSFKVSVDVPAVEVPEGAVAVYKLYHIHEGQAEEIEAEVADGKLSFVTNSFSNFVYTVDFEYTDPESGEKIAWKWPGQGSYSIASVMAEIGVTGEIGQVSLVRTLDMGGSDNVLYIEEKDGERYLTSEKAFIDVFRLTVEVDGQKHEFTITDDSDELNQGIYAEVYFIQSNGNHSSTTSVKSGEKINARIALSNSNSDAGEDAYIKVSMNGLSDLVSLNETFPTEDFGNITISTSTGVQTIQVKRVGNDLIYKVPRGVTGVVALTFETPNGITPNGTEITLTPNVSNASGETITPASNDNIGQAATGTWTSTFNWDPVDKKVNGVEHNVVNLQKDASGNPTHLDSWLHYDYNANSLNRETTGMRWTNTITITDTLELPEGITFPDTSNIHYDLANGRILYGVTDNASVTDADSQILFALALKSNMTVNSLQINGNKIVYTVTVTNPNTDGSKLTGEMDNLNYITELNGYLLNVDSSYKETSGREGKKITNDVSVTETPVVGNDPKSSTDSVYTETDFIPYSIAKEGKLANNNDADGGTVNAGDTITYTITLTNNGSEPLAADKKLSDPLPAALTMTQAQKDALTSTYPGATITENNGQLTIEYPAGNLAANGIITLTFTTTVKDFASLASIGVTSGYTIDNYAYYERVSDYTATNVSVPETSVEKKGGRTSDDPATNGDVTGYTIAFTNKNFTSSDSYTYTDNMPGYMKLKIYRTENIANQITFGEMYDGQAHTYNDVYIHALDGDTDYGFTNRFRKVNVTVDADGNATITTAVTKAGMDAMNSPVDTNGVQMDYYGYEVVFDASKVPEGNSGYNWDSIVYYNNKVQTNTNKSDEQPFYGDGGHIGVEKAVDSAQHGGSSITPTDDTVYVDSDIVTYSITVTNDTTRPYKNDIVVTDTIPVGAVPIGVTSNGTTYNDKATLDAYLGSETKTFTYEDNGTTRTVTIKRDGDGYIMVWTIPNNGSFTTETIKYPVKVDASVLGSVTTVKTLTNTVKVFNKTVTKDIKVGVQGLDYDKWAIVDGEKTRLVEVAPGQIVRYELTIVNDSDNTVVATKVNDIVPKWFDANYSDKGSSNYWSLKTDDNPNGTVNVLRTVDDFQSNGNVAYSFNVHTSALTWSDITLRPHQTLTQCIELTWPDDDEMLREVFSPKFSDWANKLNQYSIGGEPYKIVDHKQKVNKKFYFQKSVVGFSNRVNKYSYTADATTKDIFAVGGQTDVFYTLAFANTGSGAIHLDYITDIIPSELTYSGIAAYGKNHGIRYGGEPADGWGEDYSGTKNYIWIGALGDLSTSIPSGYSSVAGSGSSRTKWIKVIAEGDGSNKKFRFETWAAKNGPKIMDGVDIDINEILIFDVNFVLADNATLSDVDAITNKAQAKFDADATQKDITLTTTSTPTAEQNNGDCEVISNDGIKQIAESSVTIHPTVEVVPGILKQAVQYKEPGEGKSWTNISSHANVPNQSQLKWTITLYNDGVNTIDGYTVKDELLSIYRLNKDKTTMTFAIDGAAKSLDNVSIETTSEVEDVAGDVSKNNVYSFTFPKESGYEIPVGKTATLTFITQMPGPGFQGMETNKATFIPKQTWRANNVIHGQLEKNEMGTEYIGVSSSDYVNMFGDLATSSYKRVTEKDSATNTAVSYDASNNYITVSDADDTVTYTNVVESMAVEPFTSFVMIDKMPTIGDVGVVNADVARNSKYEIALADNANFALKYTYTNKETQQTYNYTLQPDEYVIEYSDHTAYTDADWNGVQADYWTSDPTGAKSFRIRLVYSDGLKQHLISAGMLEESTSYEVVFPKGVTLEVSYDAKLDLDATPGSLAWNSFGYRYKGTGAVTLTAEPPKVGVQAPPKSVIKKSVIDVNDQNLGTDADNQFTFYFYEGDVSADIEDLDLKTLPSNNGVFKGHMPIYTTEVAQGKSVELEARRSVNGTVTGYFVDSQVYTVLEVPTDGYSLFDYLVDDLAQSATTSGYCVFTYLRGSNVVVECVNQRDEDGFTPEAEKTIKSKVAREPKDQEFEFELYNSNDRGDKVTLKESVRNDGTGKVTFTKLEYDEIDADNSPFYYVIKEKKLSDDSLKYDETEYLLKVTVTATNGRVRATGSYQRIVPGGTNEDLEAGTIPGFVNEEVTSIEVQKLWEGEGTGTATMVLYRTTGVDAAKPTDKFIVTVTANLDNIPAASGRITVHFEGDKGHTGSFDLSNSEGWSKDITFNRGEVYDLTYTADGEKVRSVVPDVSENVENTKTITLSAEAKAAQGYTVTFSVPEEVKTYNHGTITISSAKGNLVFTKGNWADKQYNVLEEEDLEYSITCDGVFIKAVDPASGRFENISKDEAVEVSVTNKEALKKQVPIRVNWGDLDSALFNGSIEVVISGNGTSKTITLDGTVDGIEESPWNASVELDKYDDSDNEITYQVSYTPDTAEATDTGTLTFTGSSSLSSSEYIIGVDYRAPLTNVDVFVEFGFDNPTWNGGWCNGAKNLDGTNIEGYAGSWIDGSKKNSRYKLGNLTNGYEYKVQFARGGAFVVQGAEALGDNWYKFVASENKVITMMDMTVDDAPAGSFVIRNLTGNSIKLKNYYYDGYSYGWGYKGNIPNNGDLADGAFIYVSDLDTTATYAFDFNESCDYSQFVISGATQDTLKLDHKDCTVFKFTPSATEAVIITISANNSTSSINTVRSAAPKRLTTNSFMRLAGASGTSDKTFYDDSAKVNVEPTCVETDTVKPLVIQAKDLPSTATVVPASALVNSETTTAEVVITGNDSASWTNLPALDEDGNPIYYYVVEKDATADADEMSVRYSYDYNADGTISKVTITNTPVKNTTYIDVSASKQWKLVDGTNMSAFNGAKVEFTLLKNGVKVESADMNGQANPIEITGASGTAKWTNLEEGDFTYTVKETKITLPDNTVYTSDEDIAKFTANQVVSNGGTIDNIAKTKISASKEWKKAAGDVFTGTAIPANLSVKFTLMKDSTETNKSVTLTGATTTGDSYENSWTAHFTNLDKYNADGTAAVYTVKETVTQTGYSVEGSDTASDGGKITNREDHGNLEVTKSVTGLGAGETTPANYPVVILAEKDSKVYYIKNNNKTFVELSGVSSVDAVTAETLTGKEGWQWDVPTAANSKLTVENLPLGSYTVVEILSEAQKIIGNYELQTGTSTTSDTEEITANGQTASFSLENKYDKKQAKLVVTKTQINPPEGLDNSKLKFTIKPNSQANRLTLTDFDTAADGSITVPYSSFTNDSLTLDQNNGVVQGETYTVTEAWDGYVEGNVTITSTVQATGEGTATTASSKQVTVGASEMTVAFTNTYTVKIYAKKTWTQGSASMTAWPKDQKVTFQLQEKTDGDKWVDVENQGKVISSFEVVNWDNLPANKTYRVVETKVNETVLAPAIVATGDGKTEGTAFVINNDVTTSVEVDKKWFAADGTTEITETIQNASIKVQLKNDETTVVQDVDGVAFGEAGTVTLNGSETPKWHYKWDKLPKYDADGNEIAYTVFEVEAKVNTNDTLLATTGTPKIATKGESDEKFHLENTLPKTERHATKIWDDSNNAKGKRPDSITFTLTAKADGEENGMDAEKLRAEGITDVTKTIGIKEQWKADWIDLPVYTKAGKLITYGVEETAVEYYTTLISGLDDTTKTWTITNKLGDASQTLTGKKVMAQGQTPGTYSFTLTAVDNAPMPTGVEKDEQGTSSLTVQNSGETITFGTIDFTLQDMRNVEGGYDAEKTFSYTVKEVTGDSAGVVYDTKVYTASITVRYDSANGTLTADAPTYTVKASAEAEASERATEIVFTNDEKVTVEATKLWKKNDDDFQPANASVTLELQQSVDNGTNWTKVTATEADNTTANPATITASGTALEQWKASWTNLPKFTKVTTGEETNQTTETVAIQYRVIETAATLDGRTVTPIADADKTKVVEIMSATAIGTAEFTNKVTEFSFTKEWYESVDALNAGTTMGWPTENGAEIPITLTLTRKLKVEGGTEHEDKAFNGTITARPSNSTIIVQNGPDQWNIGIEKEDGEGYTFKVRYLPTDGTLQDDENTYTGTWVYYIAEDQVTNYNTPAYYYLNEGQWLKREGAAAGHNGDKIVNSKTMSFELPSTGGPGTTGLYVLGSVLTLLALVLLITKKRTDGQGIE